MKSCLRFFCWLTPFLLGLAAHAQPISPNKVNYQVIFDPNTNTYSAWAVPQYNVPNANNSGTVEIGATAQFTLKVPSSFTIVNIQDVKGNWSKSVTRLGPGNSGQDWTGYGLDPAYNYFVIGKDASETNYGSFQTGVAVKLFTFQGNGCFGTITPLPAADPFISAADDKYSLAVQNSFYSRSGQGTGGNVRAAEQFNAITGPPADCRSVGANPDSSTLLAGTSTTVNVLANDNQQGLPVSATNVTVSINTPPASGTALANPNGSISYTAAPGFTGPVSFTYKVCDLQSVSVCATATVSLTVIANVIPLPDNGTVSSGTGGVAVANVLTNDLVNGAPAVLGAGGNATVAATGVYPNGISFNPATGSVSVAVGTVPGSYTVAYQLCDKLSIPTCATTTVAVLVTPSVIANTDSGTASSGTGGVAVANVANNDIINGATAVLGTSATIVAVGTYQPGITLNPATGSVSVAVGTVPGSYTVAYQICSIIGTPACATTIVAVLVTPSVIANTDSGTASSGTGGVAVANVANNDIINGATAVLGTSATIAAIGTYQNGITLNPATGSVSVAVGTVPGSYTVAYQICSIIGTPACATTTVSVLVTPSVIANTDSGTASSGTGGVAVANVANNDIINGATAVLGTSATIAAIGTYQNGITLNPATGSVSVAVGTVPGSYTVAYQICSIIGTPACATTTVAVLVLPSVIANTDSGTASSGTGGVAVANVANNDIINGATAVLGTSATIAAVGTYPPGITLNPATGSVSVTAGVAVPGSYTVVYQICSIIGTPTCATTTVFVTVLSNINPTPDSGTAASGTGGVAVTNVVANDLVDGAFALLGTGGNATIAAIGTYAPGITLNPATGSVSVAVGTPPGTYTIAYQLCDLVSPITCATTTVTITVTPAPPVATDDINTVNINTTVTSNVLTNDYDPQGLTLTASLITPPAVGTLMVNANGSYTYTPPTDFTGLVSFTYTVCNSASLCATATATINVLPNPTVGNNAPVAHNDATRTRLGKSVRIVVLANDTDPDSPVSPNGQLTNPVLQSQPASGTAVVNADGSITYTPPTDFTGLVSFNYQVCDQASPALCSVAQVTVNVQQPPLAGTVLAPVAVDDALLTRVNTPATGNVATNDSDANSPILSLTYATGQPGSGTVVMSATGSYTYTPAAGFAGPTSFTYSVCNSTGLCSVATVNIVVQTVDKVGLLAKVYLQGALLGVDAPLVLMRDDLRAKGLLPVFSPYGSFGALTATGSLPATVTAVTGADAIVDWVFVELRSPASNTLVIDSRSALVQRDGDIVDVDGVSPVRFDVAVAGSYYVVVRHRNHLGVMSGASLPLSVSGLMVDFRSTSTGVFSYSASNLNQAQVVVNQGVALWAGNVLKDALPTAPHEFIYFQGSGNDVNGIYQRAIGSPGNFFVTPFYKLKGYFDTDVDMNGETIFQGSGNEVESIYQNVIKNHTGNAFLLPNFTIREQLP